MKILTWNINGIRAVKSSLKELFTKLDADIICLQETKVTRDQLDEPSAIVDGYNSYFSFSRVRSGYSGVATFVKDSCIPIKAEEGLTNLASSDNPTRVGHYGGLSEFSNEELQSLDSEGRAVITQHRIMDSNGEEHALTVINVYCPRADPEKDERKTFKISFYRLLQARAEAILKSGSHVIILGDVNTSHRRLDHCNPAEEMEFEAHPGRKWLNQFLCDPHGSDHTTPSTADPDASFTEDSGHNFLDSFRFFHPAQPSAYTCWSTLTGARATNYGVRIDYIFGDVELVKTAFSECIIKPEIEGSDHCPVKATVDWEIIPAKKCPPFCTKYLPEFSGKQQKLSSFFMKKPSSNPSSQVETMRYSPPMQKTEYQDAVSSSSSSASSQDSNTSEKGHGGLTREQNSTKRLLTEPGKPQSKRLKKDDKAQGGGKQGSLLSFFAKPKPVATRASPTAQSQDNVTSCQKGFTAAEPSPQKSVNATEKCTPQKNTAASWKSLLKGPPTAPLCKGHNETCLLRTVKKDGPNKGRQFWVCPRPEGHKTNPEARCEHFVWIKKKTS